MPRIILPTAGHDARELTLKGRNLRYLRDVLRVSEGETVVVLDGRGTALRTRVKEMGRTRAVLEVLGAESLDTESALGLVLVQGLLKGDKMDLVIQKVTELGVKEVHPVVTERSQVRYTRKLGHWRRVAEEAARQSQRLIVPLVHEVCGLEEVLCDLAEDSVRVVFHEHAGRGFRDLAGAMEARGAAARSPYSPAVYYMVGPEGGFSDEEIRSVEGAGFVSVSLGRRVLRAETASIAGAVLLQFLFGDL